MYWIIGIAVILIAGIIYLLSRKKDSVELPVWVEPSTTNYPQDWEDAAYLYHFKDMKPPIAESEYATKPYQHWLDWGQAAGWQWKPSGWSSAQYLINNPDVAAAGIAPLLHYWKWGQAEGRSYLKEIVGFDVVQSHPTQCFFTVKKCNDELYGGTYGLKDGSYASECINFSTGQKQVFDNETVFDIVEHAGCYFCSNEGGSKQKGMTHKLIGGVWNLVYTSATTLVLWLHSHSDGYLYAAVCDFNGQVKNHIVRSLTGNMGTWEVYLTSEFKYAYFGMTSKDGNLWTASTSNSPGHPAWGFNNCRPSIWCNRDMIYTDYTRPNQGFFCKPCAFKGNLYFGGSGPNGGARVFRFEDKADVLKDNSCESCLWVGTDGDVIVALFSNGLVDQSRQGAAKCYVSKDGSNWKLLGQFSNNILFSGSFEDDGLYLAGGCNWQRQPASGLIFKGRGK